MPSKLCWIVLFFGMVFTHCTADMPEYLIGKWRVTGFNHSISEFNESERKELNKRAQSTTYEFKPDFKVRVTSGYTKSSKMGTWYWDKYREKLVINNNSLLEDNVDTLYISLESDDEMTWRQSFNRTDTSYIHLKRVN